MYRLNKRAFEILATEVQKCSSDGEIGKTECLIVMKRLEQLRREKGHPANVDELRDTVVDVFPQFSEKAIKQAAKANQSPAIFSKIRWAAILVTTVTGVVWVVNLPYPMIRWPIAKTAPILLLPSFISMDRNYRGAVNYVEQADQLINKATSQADIERGAEKNKEAQKYLDNLPVWFLGYYPQAYCRFFSCTWKFTFDEFEDARRRVARMDAKVFQEKNAFTLLAEAENALGVAKQQYEQAKNAQEQQQAIASMQVALDTLEQIPKETLAGKTAQTKLVAYDRDFSKVTHNITGNSQTASLIEAAKVFALQAAQVSQNPPHPAEKWQQAEKLWVEAIERLQKIRVEEPNYLEAQKLLAAYQSNLGDVQSRKQAESESKQALNEANRRIQRLVAYPPTDRNQFKGELMGIIKELKTVKPGTSAYAEAQQLLISAQRLQQ
ncbi:hypothetical protein ACF3DV_05210 [Chlorogloeopsis fritschii PCC 9212]|uniref:Uncharacterized protein n=1 Tax=Chlorogloeopsis fritschii PCC 6912 TaxID=211165 RepID=A0A433MY53_CHLFR|nr:hypothetical protein [Chlorogloeopsis fritschii]RUR73164.1 hypothetical protein PCC6912_58430 [Chlorogloeopsis fritschii PCC 6912]